MTEQELQNTSITLKLPLGAVNMILDIVTDRPYKQVSALIDEIRAQAIAQVPMPAAVTEETEAEDTPVQ